MNRTTDLEQTYLMQVLHDAFRASRKNHFNTLLEQACADKFNIAFAIAHANGTATMHTALAALGVQANDEVIVPALTMSSPAFAVLHNGSIPVFADVCADTFTIDIASVRRCITPKTKAIISVALYGLPPNYDGLLQLCNEFGLYLIEDNAQCFSGRYNNKPVGSFGHFASYSFQGSKHLTSGEGGMLITPHQHLAEQARQFCGLGFSHLTASGSTANRAAMQTPTFDRHVAYGFNYKMSELCAAVALAQVQRSSELIMQRIKVAKLFEQAINGCNWLLPQAQVVGYENCYWTYSVQLKTEQPETDFAKFKQLFIKNGGDGFYAAWKLTYNEPFFKNNFQHHQQVWQAYNSHLCPVAEFVQARMVQLKTNYWQLDTAERQAEILQKTIREF
ncbi:MAG: DegT/DnrJ/EryC1/StrS family aminotransferase [Bacteroidota bacterium]